MKHFTPKVFLIALFGITFYSCEKTAVIDTDTESATDNAYCTEAFSTVGSDVNGVVIADPHTGGASKMEGKDSCLVTQLSDTLPGKWPKTITITYDSCANPNGKVKKGQILVTLTDAWRKIGSTMTTTFKDYYVDGVNLKGTVTMKRVDSLTIETTIDGKCVATGWELSYTSNGTTKWIEGSGTLLDKTDDVYTTSGGASGVTRKNKKYTVTITTPLKKRTSCKWIEEGVVELIPEGADKRVVDYGTGTCDGDATLTLNGVKFPLKM